jgi:hypothetical protein
MATNHLCPVCKTTGKSIGTQTVKALLVMSLRQVQEGYLFCKSPTCPVVYFAADGSHHFTTDQVRERVYQKYPDDDTVFVCYCFLHTLGQIRHASQPERAAISAEITAGIKANQCACDLRNPQGDCCLGNVRMLSV